MAQFIKVSQSDTGYSIHIAIQHIVTMRAGKGVEDGLVIIETTVAAFEGLYENAAPLNIIVADIKAVERAIQYLQVHSNVAFADVDAFTDEAEARKLDSGL